MKSPILIIDGSNLTARAFYSAWKKDETPDENDYRMIFRGLDLLLQEVREWNPRNVLFITDPDKCSARIEVYPGYKNRKSKCDVHKNHRKFFIGLIKRTLPVHVFGIPGYEADDVIARYCQAMPDENIVILSNDSDMIQLKQRYPDRVTVINSKGVELTFKHKDFDFCSFKALSGDTSDTIPSTGGEKAILKIINGEVDLDTWLDSGITQGKERIPRREMYERNLRLVSLLGKHALLPKPELPDINKKIAPYDLELLEDVCMNRLNPFLFHQSKMERITDQWKEWIGKCRARGYEATKKQ